MFLGKIYQLTTSPFLHQKYYRYLNTINVKTLINYQRPMSNYLSYSSHSSVKIDENKNKKSEDRTEEIIKTADLSKKEKLKKAVKEYGSTVIVFHVGISLISLGTCYLLVSM